MAGASPASDWVTLTEAGRRLGVRNLPDYKAKYAGFPEPVRVEHPRLWLWVEIEVWFAQARTPRRGV